MNKAALIASIAATALAGFDCDIAETDHGGPGKSGFYCGGGKSGVGSDVMAYCKCKKSKSCKADKKTVKTCASTEDEAGVKKTCNKPGTYTDQYVGPIKLGRHEDHGPFANCQKPVDPGKSTCAVKAGLPDDVMGESATFTKTGTCGCESNARPIAGGGKLASLTECQTKCDNNPRCLGIDYRITDKWCHTYDVATSTCDHDCSAGWEHYERSGYSQNVISTKCTGLGGSSPYTMWKDAYSNKEYLEAQFVFLDSDVEWWMLNYLTQVANTTAGLFENNVTSMRTDAGGAAMLDAWDPPPAVTGGAVIGGTKAATEYSCYRAYPACKRTGKTGSYLHNNDIDQCKQECSEVNKYVTAVYDKCVLALAGKGKASNAFQNTRITTCTDYKGLWPEYVDSNGERDCTSLCSVNVLDSGASAKKVSLATIAALFAWSM